MKQKLLTMAGALALLAVLGKYYAQPVLAQVRAALVQDVDNDARHFVQIYFLARQPVGSASFTVCNDFYSVPAGQRLVIENVGVRTGSAPGGGFATVTQTFTTSPGGCQSPLYLSTRKPTVLLPSVFQASSFNGAIYGNNQRVQAYADTGQTVSVEIGANALFDTNTAIFEVSVAGHLVSFP